MERVLLILILLLKLLKFVIQSPYHLMSISAYCVKLLVCHCSMVNEKKNSILLRHPFHAFSRRNRDELNHRDSLQSVCEQRCIQSDCREKNLLMNIFTRDLFINCCLYRIAYARPVVCGGSEIRGAHPTCAFII